MEMAVKRHVSAVILAAGQGNRMDMEATKQTLSILDKTVLYMATEAFENCDIIDDIIIVARNEELDFAHRETKDFKKVKKIVVGGESRAESAKNGFLALNCKAEYVAIHDAARCLVSNEIITRVVRDAFEYGAATASTPITDTVKVIDESGKIKSTVNRSTLCAIQTPQVFKTDLYRKALESVKTLDESITDDNMLLERIGVYPYCSKTGRGNIKITVKEDIEYAKFLLNGDKHV